MAMNFTLNDRPRLVRIMTVVFAVASIYAAAVNFYLVASVPTDENVFTDPPSTAFIADTVPAVFRGEKALPMLGGSAVEFSDSLLVGDAIIAVDGRPVKTLAEVRRRIDNRGAGDSVDVYVLRASLEAHLEYRAAASALHPGVFAEHKDVVIVTSVLAGGASDRAGMKPGDVIYRINDSSFTDAQDADRMLRRGQVDKSLRYDIYRGGTEVTLHITLAKFGFSFMMLLFFAVGLCYIGTGIFIVLKRPRLVAARLVGWGFIAVAGVLLNITVGREPDMAALKFIRTAFIFTGIFGGASLFAHSFFYFPKERMALLTTRWHRTAIYAIGAVCAAGVLFTNSQLFVLGVSVVFPYFGILQYIHRDRSAAAARPPLRTAGARAWTLALVKAAGRWFLPATMMRPIKGTLMFTGAFAFVLAALAPRLAIDGNKVAIIIIASFVLFPLAYLYTIGRYQLLDMSLRIRRNLQYSALTIVWNTVLLACLVVVFFSLPNVALPLQNVEFTGASILITDAPVSAADLSRNEKIGSMLLGLAAVFMYVVVRRKGQSFIDEKYYQTQFDYRRALSELSEALAAKLGMEDLARGLVTTLTDLLKVKHATVLFFRNGSACCCLESAGDERTDVGAFCSDDHAMLAAALKTVRDSARVEYLPVVLRGTLERMGICIVLPIRSKDQLIGALLIGEKRSETVFKDEDISFLNSAAMQASVSIENAFLYEELAEQERMKHELAIARKIQLASLPQEIPQVRGLDIAGGSLPAMEVGGDFYDYLETNGRKITVVIGDVSGKGTSAALYMSKVQGILRSLFTIGLSPRDLFIRANRLLCRDLEKRSFVTVLGAEFDLGTRTARVARAGHLPLYYYDVAEGSVAKLVPPGIGLGLNDAEHPFAMLEESVRKLHAGDMYLFVSDGITEAHNEAGDDFGEDRLCAFLGDHHGEPSSLVCDMLYAEVRAFAGGAAQHDDQTIVCIAVTEL